MTKPEPVDAGEPSLVTSICTTEGIAAATTPAIWFVGAPMGVSALPGAATGIWGVSSEIASSTAYVPAPPRAPSTSDAPAMPAMVRLRIVETRPSSGRAGGTRYIGCAGAAAGAGLTPTPTSAGLSGAGGATVTEASSPLE